MGLCHGKPIEHQPKQSLPITNNEEALKTPLHPSKPSPSGLFPFSPLPSLFKTSPSVSSSPSVTSTPLRIFKLPFPPPSPAKHIRAFLLARRHGSAKPGQASISEGSECGVGLDKAFGFSKQFGSCYEIDGEVGRGHFGFTCSAKGKKGSLKGHDVAVKVIPKSKVRSCCNLMRSLDMIMVPLVFMWIVDCWVVEGGKYSEEDAKKVMVQILSVVAYCHLQGVVHRDLKPENFLFSTKEETSPLKAIDFGLSDSVRPDERLNDIVGSAYYVAPEVLHRTYGTDADMWSIGVIAYILLCGSRPFWARSESGIFRAVLKTEPNFQEAPWPSLSPDAVDFVKLLLNKDYRKRLTASQALCHPWLAGSHELKIPSDMIIYKLVKVYVMSSSLRKSALSTLAKTLTVPQLTYLREQFNLLGPSKSGSISMQNYKTISCLQYKKLDFEEFCASAISVYQLEAMGTWEQHARRAYELFEKDGNRVIMIEELASELGLGPSVPVHVVLQDWIRHSDGKLSFLGFVRLLHGVSSRTLQKA
ncbi:hypothetical protein Bca101_046161 [Brassica carinata]